MFLKNVPIVRTVIYLINIVNDCKNIKYVDMTFYSTSDTLFTSQRGRNSIKKKVLHYNHVIPVSVIIKQYSRSLESPRFDKQGTVMSKAFPDPLVGSPSK